MIKGKVNEQLDIIVEQSYKEHLTKLINKVVTFDIPEIFYSKRSLLQNSYLHGVVIPMILDFELESGSDWLAGLSAKQATALVKQHIYANILGQTISEAVIDGRYYFTLNEKPMSKMNTVEFGYAVTLIQMYYAKKGLNIPDPKTK